MESENRRIITFQDLKQKVAKLKSEYPDETKWFGVPRGGMYIAAMLNPVDDPREADVIVDDLIDSGATRDRYKKEFPDKPFVALYEKDLSRPEWLVFPWEMKEEPVEDNMLRILEYIGENPNREGLQETPKRYLKFMREFLSPPEFNFTTFDAEGTDEMIIQMNIPFFSLCEHHLAPFYGVGHIAYIPKDKIVGLSKLARTLETYSRRLQNQERITAQVAERLMEELDAKGVAVVIKAQHLCMAMRGVKKHDTWTVTSKLVGVFKEGDPRAEFLSFINK